jgi:hypothetical protein
MGDIEEAHAEELAVAVPGDLGEARIHPEEAAAQVGLRRPHAGRLEKRLRVGRAGARRVARRLGAPARAVKLLAHARDEHVDGDERAPANEVPWALGHEESQRPQDQPQHRDGHAGRDEPGDESAGPGGERHAWIEEQERVARAPDGKQAEEERSGQGRDAEPVRKGLCIAAAYADVTTGSTGLREKSNVADGRTATQRRDGRGDGRFPGAGSHARTAAP